MSGTPALSIGKIDWKKIGIGALVALGGTLLTYVSQIVANTDFGVFTPLVVSGWAIVVNILRKFLTDTSQ